jgi:cell wall-associated NlpC family hydrolase
MSDATPLDPRFNAYREDLASAALRGRVAVDQFAEGEVGQVSAPSAPLRRAPRFDAPLDTEALRGEIVTIYEEKEGWAWVQLDRDRYVGYLPADALSKEQRQVTHRVTALRTFVFPSPDIKAPPLDLVSLNAGIAATGEQDKFLELQDGGFLFADHAAPADQHAPDFIEVAQRFVGTPYLWGGRTSIGVDCSGLVQLSLEAAGIAAPRDTDVQEAALGEPLSEPTNWAAAKPGDLIFWKGHVGIVNHGGELLHANAHHMATAAEPLDQGIKRIAEAGNAITSIRRL